MVWVNDPEFSAAAHILVGMCIMTIFVVLWCFLFLFGYKLTGKFLKNDNKEK